MKKEDLKEVHPAPAGFALPPIPKGKKAVWVGDTLKLVDDPEEVVDNRPITERVKTFEDACNILGENHPCVIAYNAFEHDVMAVVDAKEIADVAAYLKLRIIATALNEGWKPEFTENEYRWYPWFYLYTQEEIDEMTEERKKELSLLLWGGRANHGSYCGLGYVYSGDRFLVLVCDLRLSPCRQIGRIGHILRSSIHRNMGRLLFQTQSH